MTGIQSPPDTPKSGSIFGREPTLIFGLIQAVIALAVGFGLSWTGEQVALVLATTGALLTVITRTQVSPHVSK